jgi:hypothetical protein
VYGVYYVGLYNNGGAGIILPPFKEIWTHPLATFTTTITQNYHN